ncbi:hypothetical protein DYY65_11090 [Nitrososphaera sp. AFS]|nr:hypothetical protein [Nitrososphaera sp. AFS]
MSLTQLVMATKVRWRKQGTVEPKGQSGSNKIKTKAKTVKGNRNLSSPPQKIAVAKATKTNLDSDRNRHSDEVAPAAVSDLESTTQ